MKLKNWIGGSITVVWVAGFVWYVLANWSKVAGMEPNALGDMLAGAFGPVAFLWLVLGYLQQGEELQQNTAALAEQANELRRQVKQQEALVAAAEQQAEEARDAAFKAEARHAQDRHNEAARRQPFITNWGISRTADHSGRRWLYTVGSRNVGAPCHVVRIDRKATEIAARQLMHVDHGPVAALAPWTFSFTWSDDDARVPWWFRVHYIDAGNQRRRFVVQVSVRPAGEERRPDFAIDEVEWAHFDALEDGPLP